MLKKTDQDTKIQISKKLRWIALFFQSIILIPAVKVGYVIPENIPFYLIFLFIVLLSNLDLVSKFFPRHKALLIHLSIDLCCFTGLIFLSGKMENPFWPLIYLHAGVAAILLNPKEEYYFIPLLTSSMLTIHLASYSFHTALLYVIVPQWIILMTTWALTRSLGITLLRQSEKLTRLEKKDQKIQKLKSIGSLSAGILHELGTPLNTLRIKVDKLKNGIKQDFTEKDYKYLNLALKQCESIVSKLNSAQQEMALKITNKDNLHLYLKEKIESFKDSFPDIQLKLNSQNNSECVFAKVNLSIILDIILENAQEVGVTAISFEVKNEKDYIQILIQDNGPGFSPFIIENFGAPYTTTKGRGRGLGLFTASMSLESMGAEMNIENNDIGALIKLGFLKD